MTIIQGWGLNVPEDMSDKIVVTWGARAIYTGQQIDLVPDRQSWHVAGLISKEPAWHAAIKRLADWVKKVGFPFLRKQAKTLFPDECRVVELNEGGFHIEASPQSSCGYLYIRAWELKADPCPYSEGQPSERCPHRTLYAGGMCAACDTYPFPNSRRCMKQPSERGIIVRPRPAEARR
jgi:hypothetical protein